MFIVIFLEVTIKSDLSMRMTTILMLKYEGKVYSQHSMVKCHSSN